MNTCAEAHITSKCTSVTKKCEKCDYSNQKFHTKYNVNHSAIDSDLCEILKSKIKKYIEMTDYPSLPTYPRFFGKVESLQFHRRAPIRRTRFASTDSATSQFARNTGTTIPIRNASSTPQVSSNTETTYAVKTTPINQNG